jgi:hypothetical protein
MPIDRMLTEAAFDLTGGAFPHQVPDRQERQDASDASTQRRLPHERQHRYPILCRRTGPQERADDPPTLRPSLDQAAQDQHESLRW